MRKTTTKRSPTSRIDRSPAMSVSDGVVIELHPAVLGEI